MRRPNRPPEAVTKYQQLAQSIRQRKGRTTSFFLVSIAVNLSFAVWGWLIYGFVQGSCKRPIRSLIMACSAMFTVMTLLTTCLFFLVRNMFYNVEVTHEHVGDPEVAYRRVPAEEDLENGDGPEKDVFVATQEITDQLTMACCSYTCLLCSFGSFLAALFTALTWILVEENDCKTSAPQLFSAAKAYTMGLCGLFFLHIVWFGLACTYCASIFEIYHAQQKFASYASSRQYHPTFAK